MPNRLAGRQSKYATPSTLGDEEAMHSPRVLCHMISLNWFNNQQTLVRRCGVSTTVDAAADRESRTPPFHPWSGILWSSHSAGTLRRHWMSPITATLVLMRDLLHSCCVFPWDTCRPDGKLDLPLLVLHDHYQSGRVAMP